MNIMTNNEMYNVTGGAAITSSMINAITKAVGTIYKIGQSVGSSLRRVIGGNFCSL